MENKLFQQAKKEIQAIKLLPEERVKIMTEILIGEPAIESLPTYKFFLFRRSLVSITALVLIIAVGAGTSLAAEGSLPGDLLYPIKVKINEPIRGATKFTPETKAHWEEEKVNRRLKEAQTLAVKEKLNEETRNELESLLDDHLQSFDNSLKQAEKVEDEKKPTKAEEAKMELEETVNNYSQQLKEEDEREEKKWAEKQQEELKKIEEKIKNKKQELEKEESEGDISGRRPNVKDDRQKEVKNKVNHKAVQETASFPED